MTTTSLAVSDLATDRELAQAAESYRFVLDVTPADVEENREKFRRGAIGEPSFTYRELEDDPDVIDARLKAIDVDSIEDATLGHLPGRSTESSSYSSKCSGLGIPQRFFHSASSCTGP